MAHHQLDNNLSFHDSGGGAKALLSFCSFMFISGKAAGDPTVISDSPAKSLPRVSGASALRRK